MTTGPLLVVALSLGNIRTPDDEEIRTPDGEARPPRGRLDFWVAVGMTVSFAVLVGLLLIPIPQSPHPFQASINVSKGAATWSQPFGFPEGSSVTGTWMSMWNVSVGFEILDQHDDYVYAGVGTSGSFSFLADSSPYVFVLLGLNATQSHVSGTYTSASEPLL